MSSEIIFPNGEDLTPQEIVRELDKYIIGQKDAKKSVAIALRNRSRRKKLEPEMQEEIAPKNIIMIGPTGVGKTEIARRLSRLVNAPFAKVEITKYTEVGYVGRDVESMVRDLVSISISMVKKEYGRMVEEKARHNAEERILDILLPEKQFDTEEMKTLGFATSYDDDLARRKDRENKFHNAREKCRQELRSGVLDEQEIEYDVAATQAVPVMSIMGMGGPGMEDMDVQIQNMLGDILPKKSRRKKIAVADAKKIFFDEETEKLIDFEKVNNEAIRRVEEMGIIFIDEIDKIAGTEAKSGPDVSRQGVQRDLLPVIEGTSVNTKYGTVKTNHILFIAAGAFNVSKPSDLIPELQGRFPIRVQLNSLTEDDFKSILVVPKNSLVRQYSELLLTEGVKLIFKEDGLDEIARISRILNEEHENIGARRLHTTMEKCLEDILFNAPDLKQEEKQIEIDARYVRSRLDGIIKNRDLSRYIL